MATRLRIATFPLGDWMTNCYVLHAAAAHRQPVENCWIVDAGFAPEALIAYIREHHLTPDKVVLTHAHLDHIAGLDTIRGVWPEVPILIHAAEEGFLIDPELNLSVMLEEPIIAPRATGTLTHGQTLTLGELAFEVRHTPGHSPGGISLYQADEGVVLVGDALFAGSIGRSDFPTSNPAELIESIRSQLLSLPDATRVLPGHGPATTIGKERSTNRFL